MITEELKSHLEAIRSHIRQVATEDADSGGLSIKKTQLQAVQKTMRSLEKKGVPIPDGLRAEKMALASEVEALENTTSGYAEVYDGLLDIIEELGRACGKRPHRDLYVRSRERRRQTIRPETLRQAIVEILGGLGAGGSEQEVLDAVGNSLQARLTPADQEQGRDGWCRWRRSARREARRMIDEGILTADSRKGAWKLKR